MKKIRKLQMVSYSSQKTRKTSVKPKKGKEENNKGKSKNKIEKQDKIKT